MTPCSVGVLSTDGEPIDGETIKDVLRMTNGVAPLADGSMQSRRFRAWCAMCGESSQMVKAEVDHDRAESISPRQELVRVRHDTMRESCACMLSQSTMHCDVREFHAEHQRSEKRREKSLANMRGVTNSIQDWELKGCVLVTPGVSCRGLSH